MSNNKKVRIEVDYAQFADLLVWCMDLPDYEHTPLWRILSKKVDALQANAAYTTYKTARTPEEREKARQAYLDQREIPESFRW